jgi:hypothetical protein
MPHNPRLYPSSVQGRRAVRRPRITSAYSNAPPQDAPRQRPASVYGNQVPERAARYGNQQRATRYGQNRGYDRIIEDINRPMGKVLPSR